MNLYRIGTAARLADLTVTTLRNWERRYALVTVGRSAKGQRLYSHEDVERLRALKKALDGGLSAIEAHNLIRAGISAVDKSGCDVHQEAFRPLADAHEMRQPALEGSTLGRRIRALVNATWDVVYRMSPDWSEMHALTGRGFIANARKPTFDWLDEYIAPDDQPDVLAAIQTAIATTSVFELEHRVRRPDGTLGWMLSRAVPLVDQGHITEWVGAAMDITARHDAEEAARRSAARLSSLLDTDGVGVYCFDRSGEVLDASDAFLRMTGYARADVGAGRLNRRMLATVQDLDDTEMQLERIAVSGRLGPYERDVACSDGSQLHVLSVGRDLGDGTVCEYLVDIVGIDR